ncbi:LmeA family phospholipid-binding protein [Kitasatospora sp. NPDC088346]|uniref:LmeA family phospholipid-binding protein n=1 Tax=Kitasatospora sp. NPDC088346 TaxID=3364073 RepID=UPI00381C5D59
MNARPQARRPRRRRAALVSAVAALTVVAAAGAGEYAARGLIRHRVLAAAPSLGGDPAVHPDGSALWDLLHRRIPRLDVSSDDALVGPLAHASVRAHLDGVRLGGTTARVAGSHAEVTVPTASIGAAVQDAVPSMPVGAVTTDPAAGTVVVTLGRGGIGRLTLRPTLDAGRVSFPVAELTLLGRSVPPERLGAAAHGLGPAAGPQRPYPLALRATTATVLPDGVRITLDGGPADLPAP